MLNKKLTDIVYFLKKHVIIVLYIITTLIVALGLFNYTGQRHVDKVTIYLASISLFYFGVHKLFLKGNIYDLLKKIQISIPVEKSNKVAIAIAVGVCLFTFYHYYFLGHIPVISALKSTEYYKIALIRQSIIEHDNNLVKYLSAFVIKGFMPFLLFYLYLFKRKFFYIISIFFILYSLALMQRALIVTIFVPLIGYLFITKQYKSFLCYSFIPVVGIFFLVYTTNPDLRSSNRNKVSSVSKEDKSENENLGFKGLTKNFSVAGDAIYERIFFTTGQVVGYWFDKIPSELPYAKGCGYRFLAPVLGCDFEKYDYPRIIYDKIYLLEASKGLKGTVTVASFVYDYANFGMLGFVFSGLIHALFFCFINGLMEFNFLFNVSFNLLPVIWLSSGPLSTIILSGGWAIIILLFLLFRKKLIKLR